MIEAIAALRAAADRSYAGRYDGHLYDQLRDDDAVGISAIVSVTPCRA